MSLYVPCLSLFKPRPFGVYTFSCFLCDPVSLILSPWSCLSDPVSLILPPWSCVLDPALLFMTFCFHLDPRSPSLDAGAAPGLLYNYPIFTHILFKLIRTSQILLLGLSSFGRFPLVLLWRHKSRNATWFQRSPSMNEWVNDLLCTHGLRPSGLYIKLECSMNTNSDLGPNEPQLD